MNLAELSIKKSTITWVLTILMVVVGAKAFFSLSWLEDPEFTIKEASVFTPYPGASAAEVEEEVTNVLEKAVQQLGQLKYVESRSTRGMSMVHVVIKDQYDKYSLPQVWDELRRKVNDAQSQLPPGAGPSSVNDDFGDVYGIYVAITGQGYTYKEIYDYAKFLQRELLLATDVKKIVFYGNQPEVINIEMRREKMAELGISQQDIYRSLAAKNLPVESGNITLGREYIAVNPTGEFKSEQQFGDLLISSKDQESGSLIYLRDVADIKRGYQDPAKTYVRFDKKPAVGLGISTVQGGNVITMGESLQEKFKELENQIPLGMEMNVISMQTEAVKTAINGFLVNLGQAVAIVVIVLLIFMGLRSGLIIGAILLITIMGTFVFMAMGEVTLERISLGALVIALGMLVDNAIVVVDGMRVKMEQGTDALTAAKEIVGQTAVPLLGATIVAITAFASIGTSQDSTGEYCRTLFSVIMISLFLSWVTAVTTTPLFCKTFLKQKKQADDDAPQKDPYGGKFYQIYRSFLTLCIKVRWLTVGVVIAMFIAALVGFGSVKNSFFPDSTRPQFMLNFWFPEGTHIDSTSKQLGKAEAALLEREDITHVSTLIGGGQIRFLLTYTPEKAYASYAQMLVSVEDYNKIPLLLNEVLEDMEEMFPMATINTRAFILGPSSGGKIQLRISGPDHDEVRKLALKAEEIMRADPVSKGIRNEWLNKVKVLRPQMSENQARDLGITRPDIGQAMQAAVEGTPAGIYREGDELLTIIARAPESERYNFDSLESIQVWSPVADKMVSMGQVVNGFKTEFEDAHIWRRDRTTMLKMHADVRQGLPSEMLARVKPKIEQALGVDVVQKIGRDVKPEEWNVNTIPVKDRDKILLKGKPGYHIAWGGEAEDSARANASLGSTIPIFFGLMVLIVLMLFNSIKKTMIIWLTVPLAIIGVTVGLLSFNQPFGFMALLGLMSLAGMLIKNAIVLIDQIDIEMASDKPGLQAITDSGVSRLIPVSMAAATTILGMIPLLKDAFFVAMAVTIMFGLGFATLLTLIFVPVLYAIFFKVKS